ncbi:MAG: hypothetical protein KGI02_07630 [Thaumarchaeota archaeon]|nr:hypothetical protein [Nitrososphaerota archaeon]MDE1840881.1 hypothetical protein [Nitrososphaerota archaeon]MDE1877474.1 hypothetical protein [Nitrososphaerota archaeon]
MQRRGISEIYSTILMFTISLAIAGVVMISSCSKILVMKKRLLGFISIRVLNQNSKSVSGL